MPFGKIVARQKPMLNKLVIWSNTTSHRILRLGWIGLLVVSIPSGYLATAGFKSDVFSEQGLNFYAIFPSLVIFISNIVISIFANFSHQRLEKRMNSRLADSDTLLANGDLEKAVGMSIAVLLVDTSKTHPDVTENTKNWINKHQGKIPYFWHEIVEEEIKKGNTVRFKELLPDKLSDIIKNRPQPLVETEWYEILVRLGVKASDPFPGSKNTPDTVALVARLSKEFCKVFWEYIKEDSVNQGYAAKALELIIQREILNNFEEIRQDIQRLQATGNEIQATGEDSNIKITSVHEMVTEIRELLIKDGRDSTSDQVADITKILQDRLTKTTLERDKYREENKKLKERLVLENATLAKPPQPQASDSNFRFLAIKYFEKAYDLAIVGKFVDALNYLNFVIDLDPNLTQAYNNRGNVKSALGRMEEALLDYDEAIRLDPNYAEAYCNRGNVKSAFGRMELALLDYNEAIRLDPNDPQAYYNLACLHAKRGELEFMEINLAQAITLDPGCRLLALDDSDFRDVLTTPEFRRAIGNP